MEVMNTVDLFAVRDFLSDWVDSSSVTTPRMKCKAKKLSALKRKRGSSSLESSTIEAPKQEIPKKSSRLCLPKNPAKVYAEKIVIGLNFFDSSLLFQQLQKLCATEVKITKHVYSLKQERFDSRVFPDLTSFCGFMEAWHRMIPDGYFEAFSERMVVNSLPTFVFISCLSFRGHKLVKDVDLLRIPFDDFESSVHDEVISEEQAKHHFQDWDCRLEGSLCTHVNIHGKITALELYLSEDGI